MKEARRWDDGVGGKKEGKKETTSTSFLSRLSRRTVCILSRAAPREFNSIFNLPKPLYANFATNVEYFWTFSSLFCVLSALFPPPSPPSPLQSVHLPLVSSSLWHSFLPIEFVERKEARVLVTSCLLYERMLQRGVSGMVLNKAAEKGETGIDCIDRRRAIWS